MLLRKNQLSVKISQIGLILSTSMDQIRTTRSGFQEPGVCDSGFWFGSFKFIFSGLNHVHFWQPVLRFRIRDTVLFWSLDPGWEKIRIRDPESWMNTTDNFSESLKQILGKKYLNSLMRIRNRDLFDSGSGMEKFGSGIWYKHPGSATLLATSPNILISWNREPHSLDKRLISRSRIYLTLFCPGASMTPRGGYSGGGTPRAGFPGASGSMAPPRSVAGTPRHPGSMTPRGLLTPRPPGSLTPGGRPPPASPGQVKKLVFCCYLEGQWRE
jgi:hypothetical protein